jgi:hypothetical protein
LAGSAIPRPDSERDVGSRQNHDLALYLAVTEHRADDLAEIGEGAGLSDLDVQAGMSVLTSLGLVSDGALVT